MDLSTPLRRISAAGAQIIGRISEEVERPVTGAGEDVPEGASTNELDNILNGDRVSVGGPDRSNVRFSSDPAGDEAPSGNKRRFSFPADDKGVEYSISGITSTPNHTSKYDAVIAGIGRRGPRAADCWMCLGVT